jgi:CBS domain-containing protein
MPVVDTDQQLVGIITESDIFRAFVGVLGAGGATQTYSGGA